MLHHAPVCVWILHTHNVPTDLHIHTHISVFSLPPFPPKQTNNQAALLPTRSFLHLKSPALSAKHTLLALLLALLLVLLLLLLLLLVLVLQLREEQSGRRWETQ
jgi:hypothetical protein